MGVVYDISCIVSTILSYYTQAKLFAYSIESGGEAMAAVGNPHIPQKPQTATKYPDPVCNIYGPDGYIAYVPLDSLPPEARVGRFVATPAGREMVRRMDNDGQVRQAPRNY